MIGQPYEEDCVPLTQCYARNSIEIYFIWIYECQYYKKAALQNKQIIIFFNCNYWCIFVNLVLDDLNLKFVSQTKGSFFKLATHS